MWAWVEEDKVRLARSQAVRRRRRARWLEVMSLRCFFLNSPTQYSTYRWVGG